MRKSCNVSLPDKKQIQFLFNIPASVTHFPQRLAPERRQYCFLLAVAPSPTTAEQSNILLGQVMCLGNIRIQDISYLKTLTNKLIKYCSTSAQLIVKPFLKCSYSQTARLYQRWFQRSLSCLSVNIFISDFSDGGERLHCSWQRAGKGEKIQQLLN